MTILYSSSIPVKSASFGRGLFAYVPHHRADHTVSDARWLAEQLQLEADRNAEIDRQAEEAYFLSRHEAGYGF